MNMRSSWSTLSISFMSHVRYASAHLASAASTSVATGDSLLISSADRSDTVPPMLLTAITCPAAGTRLEAYTKVAKAMVLITGSYSGSSGDRKGPGASPGDGVPAHGSHSLAQRRPDG